MSNTQFHDTRPMSVGDWLVTHLVLSIPIVNVVMFFVWSLSSTGNVNRRNYCIAAMVWWLIVLGIVGTIFTMLLLLGVLAQHHTADRYVESMQRSF